MARYLIRCIDLSISVNAFTPENRNDAIGCFNPLELSYSPTLAPSRLRESEVLAVWPGNDDSDAPKQTLKSERIGASLASKEKSRRTKKEIKTKKRVEAEQIIGRLASFGQCWSKWDKYSHQLVSDLSYLADVRLRRFSLSQQP